MARVPPPADGDERALLLGWLAFHRDALAAKCEGLSPRQLVEQASPPSRLSLLGLVRHLTEMERAYVHAAMTARPVSMRYCTAETPEGDFEDMRPEDAATSLEAWIADCRTSDTLLADRPLDDAVSGRSVRWRLCKLLVEYARHCGHADLLRERIDGTTGE